MKPLVIYHGNCMDGFTAAWVIWCKHKDWDFYPAKHGDPPPDPTGREVIYMVDFSYKRPVILEMATPDRSIFILDHHKTAQADLVDLPSNVSVTFDMDKSGARLAWDYFNPEKSTAERPMLIDYVEDRDLWRFKYPETKDICAFIFSQPYDFYTWDGLATMAQTQEYKAEMVVRGKAILQKQSKDIDELLQNKFRMKIGGVEVPVCNLPYTFSSEAGQILAKGEPFGATFYVDKQYAYFSLRSEENGMDVSDVAKKYGGGGHKHAAGFKIGFRMADNLFYLEDVGI